MKTCEADLLKSIWHGVMWMERVEPNYTSLSDSAKNLLTPRERLRQNDTVAYDERTSNQGCLRDESNEAIKFNHSPLCTLRHCRQKRVVVLSQMHTHKSLIIDRKTGVSYTWMISAILTNTEIGM